MNWTLIISYFVLLLIQALGLTFIPISLIAELLKKIKIPLQFGVLFGGIIVWFLLNMLWLEINDYNLPLIVFGLCWFIKLYKSLGNNKINPKMNNLMLKSEAFAIFLIALYVLIFREFNWY